MDAKLLGWAGGADLHSTAFIEIEARSSSSGDAAPTAAISLSRLRFFISINIRYSCTSCDSSSLFISARLMKLNIISDYHAFNSVLSRVDRNYLHSLKFLKRTQDSDDFIFWRCEVFLKSAPYILVRCFSAVSTGIWCTVYFYPSDPSGEVRKDYKKTCEI